MAKKVSVKEFLDKDFFKSDYKATLLDLEELTDNKKTVGENELCPSCGSAYLKREFTKKGEEKHIVSCPSCFINYHTFIPMYFQRKFINDIFSHKYRTLLMIGGYGTGKTEVGIYSVVILAMLSPGGHSLLGTTDEKTMENFDNNVEKFIPSQAIKSQKQGLIVLNNGHKLEFRSLGANISNLKNRNLDYIYMDEGHEIGLARYQQLQKRSRGKKTWKKSFKTVAGKKIETGLPMIILSSNVELGWLDEEIIAKSGTIVKYDNQNIAQDTEHLKETVCTHIVRTDQNYYLSGEFAKDYISEGALTLPKEEIDRHYFSKLGYASGLVYKNTHKAVITDAQYEVRDYWINLITADFGGGGRNDPTVFLHFVIDPFDKKIYLHKEFVYQDNVIVEDISKEILAYMAKYMEGRWVSRWPLGDQAGGTKRTGDNSKSWFDYYEQNGLYIEPANTGSNYFVDTGINKVQTLFFTEQLLINSNCLYTLSELKKYKRDDKNKLIDKDNHAMDALRYAIININLNQDMAHFQNIIDIFDGTKEAEELRIRDFSKVGIDQFAASYIQEQIDSDLLCDPDDEDGFISWYE